MFTGYHVPRVLSFHVLHVLFHGPMFPGSYVPTVLCCQYLMFIWLRVLCSHGPMFPQWFVSAVLCFRVLCSQDPMLPRYQDPMFWRSYVPRIPCSHMFSVLCGEGTMFLVSYVPMLLHYQGTRVLCSWDPMFPISTYVLSTRSQARGFKLFGRLIGVDMTLI